MAMVPFRRLMTFTMPFCVPGGGGVCWVGGVLWATAAEPITASMAPAKIVLANLMKISRLSDSWVQAGKRRFVPAGIWPIADEYHGCSPCSPHPEEGELKRWLNLDLQGAIRLLCATVTQADHLRKDTSWPP